MIYTIIINPLERLIAWLFNLFLFYIPSSTVALILVSFTVSLFVAIIAQKNMDIGSVSSDKKQRIARALNGISGVTNSREKYYYTKEIYRINGYRQWEALTGLLPLIIQIPLFVAAYYAFRDNEILRNSTFAGVFELGIPDGLVFKANALPILMTLINILGVYIARKDRSRGELLQSIALAVFFMVILYNQPSGLVLYWIFNNVFSILRDVYLQDHTGVKPSGFRIFYRRFLNRITPLVDRHKNILLTKQLILCAMFITAYYSSDKTSKEALFLLLMALLSLWFFAIVTFAQYRSRPVEALGDYVRADRSIKRSNGSIKLILVSWSSLIVLLALQQKIMFWSSNGGFLVLVGCLVSEAFISKRYIVGVFSYKQKSQEVTYEYRTIASVIVLFFMTQLFVMLKIYFLNVSDFQTNTYAIILPVLLELLVLVLAALALTKYFSNTYATALFIFSVLSTLTLFYASIGGSFVLKNFMLEDVAVIARGRVKGIIEVFTVFLVALLEWYLIVVLRNGVRKKEKGLRLIAFSLSFAMTLTLTFITIRQREKILALNETVKESDSQISRLKLSNKNNTIVLLLDGFPGNLMSNIIEDRPELLTEYSGFTWYPDAISLGAWTWNGAPAVYGGNEYSPDRLMDSKGTLVYSVLDDTVKRHIDKGRLVNFYREPFFKSTEQHERFHKYDFVPLKKRQLAKTYRNRLVNIAFLQVAPFCLKPHIYNDGSWILSEGTGGNGEVDYDALDRYEFITTLPTIEKNLLEADTVISYVYVNISHGPYSILEDGSLSKEFLGDYWHPEGQRYSAIFALKQVASLLANMKALGIYDSSQIVIVSDHGNPGIEKKMTWDAGGLLAELGTRAGWYDCLLMYKAPNAIGPLQSDFDRFMTNADVPDLIEAGLAGVLDDYLSNLKPDRSLRHYIQYNNLHEKEVTIIEMRGTSLDTSAWSVEHITGGE